MRMTRFNITALCCTAFLMTAFTSCNDINQKSAKVSEDVAKTSQKIQEVTSDHKWYYFSNGSYSEIDLPQHSPILSLKPWTESVRISDGNTGKDGKGYLLVNRVGLMVFDKNAEPSFIQDYHLFSDSTAENLVFEGFTPFFTLSKNSFFNQSASSPKSKSDAPHLVRLSQEGKLFYPSVTYGDLGIGDSSEVSETYFDGKNWYSSIKSTSSGKTEFKYIQWSASSSLSSLQPATQKGKITVKDSSESSFRSIKSPVNFSKAPSRLKDLISFLPADFDFLISCHDSGGCSPRYFFRGDSSDCERANAILAENWVCAIFGDGTTYFCGGLDGQPLINGGKTVAFRLPKLPESYSYGDFCISGNYLTVSWEENDFYKTGRSGFLSVDMKQIFENK